MKKLPTFQFEQTHWNNGKFVIGIDEVGRGSFAGPLYVGGVVFPILMHVDLVKEIELIGINDSKLLTEKRRNTLVEFIKKYSLFYAITGISVVDINKVGIGKAGKIGMEHVAETLRLKLLSKNPLAKCHILTDAFEIDRKNFPDQTPIVRGDSLSISIAAASIMAKVARDKYMTELSMHFPYYQWNQNKGYGTTSHRNALIKYGPTVNHRREFIKKYISQ